MKVNLRLAFLCLISAGAMQNCRTPTSPSSDVKYETDQYSTQIYFADSPLSDSTDVINEVINQGIQTVISHWVAGDTPDILSAKISEYFGRRQLEVWVIDNPRVSSFLPGTEVSVFRESDYLSQDVEQYMKKMKGYVRTPLIAAMKSMRSPIIANKGLATNLQVNGVEFGADKLTHFFALGMNYLSKYQEAVAKELQARSQTSLQGLAKNVVAEIEAKARASMVRFGVSTENGKWGKLATGVFSNADLVANYQGFMWLKGVADGTSQNIGWTPTGLPYQTKLFDLRDFVNDYWNEAMNPNSYAARLAPFVKASLYQYCGIYKEFSGHFVSEHTNELEARFKMVGLAKFGSRKRLRLDFMCEEFYKLPESEQVKYPQVKRAPDIDPNLLRSKTHGLTLRNEQGEFIENLDQIKAKLRAALIKLPDCSRNLERVISEFDLLQRTHGELKNKAALALNAEIGGAGAGFLPTVLGAPPVHQCVQYPVKGDQVRQEVNLYLEYCKDADSHINYRYMFNYDSVFYRTIEEANEFFNSVVDGRHDYFSSEGFFGFDNLVGYAYRGVPAHCRWY